MQVCAVVFDPIYKPKIWGGRRLQSVAGKELPPDELIGESWEVADLDEGQSVVRSGPAKGTTLAGLVKEWGTDLLGRAGLFEGRFPLLIKYLDANEHLSVQVHPDEAMAKRLGGNIRVKNEAWYVLHAEPDGAIYRGFVEGVTRESFAEAIERGKVTETLRRIPVKSGQCYYLPSGTIHALGAGVVVAEVQTPSDTTYRIYDWDRVDASTGLGRALHISEALECINFDSDDGGVQERSHVGSVWTTVTKLMRCDSFMIELVRMVEGIEQDIPTGEIMVWMLLEGRGEIQYDGGRGVESFGRGDTILVPAGVGQARIKTLSECVWLETTIPVSSELSDFPRPDRAELSAPAGPGLVQIDVRPSERDK